MSKIQEAIAIFAANLILFILIILSVRVPVNILIELIVMNTSSAADEFSRLGLEFRINNALSAIFDPIYIGALIYCLWQMQQGITCTYSQALNVGIKNWGKLFTARFIAGFFIILGCLALVVPGIILALRYALIDTIVIIEGYGKASTVLQRSTYLTTGKKREIFGVALLAFVLMTVVFFLASLVLYLPLGFLKIEANMFTNVIEASIQDIIISTYTIIMFLFYWQARSEEPNT